MTRYLMVHDLVWINTTVTGRTIPFSYQALEAVVAAQYDYGEQPDDVRPLAVRVLETMLASRPFASGNLRTGFIAALTLLAGNGCALDATGKEAADLVRRAAGGEISAADVVEKLAGEPGPAPTCTLRQLVAHLCNAYADALAQLAEGND